MNKGEFKKLLAELGEELKKTLDEIKVQFHESKSLHIKITSYVESAQTLIDKITNEETGLDKILTNAQTIESQILSLKNGADTHLQSITRDLSSIQNHITEMETAYTKFSEINAKITNEETGLDKILTTSQSLKSEIEATKQTSETIFKEISKLKDTASIYIADLKIAASSAKKTVELITKNHEESEDLKSKINDIFNLSSHRVHANYFDGRKSTLGKISFAWLVAFFILLLLTIIFGDRYISPLIQAIERNNGEAVRIITIETVLIRLGLVTPLIAVTIYCMNQFNKERRLYEQYAFKAVSMLSIESSIQLLRRSLGHVLTKGERDNQIAMFAVKTMESIYKDPITTDKTSWFFKGGNKILELSAEINETVGEIKDDVDKIVDAASKNK